MRDVEMAKVNDKMHVRPHPSAIVQIPLVAPPTATHIIIPRWTSTLENEPFASSSEQTTGSCPLVKASAAQRLSHSASGVWRHRATVVLLLVIGTVFNPPLGLFSVYLLRRSELYSKRNQHYRAEVEFKASLVMGLLATFSTLLGLASYLIVSSLLHRSPAPPHPTPFAGSLSPPLSVFGFAHGSHLTQVPENHPPTTWNISWTGGSLPKMDFLLPMRTKSSRFLPSRAMSTVATVTSARPATTSSD